MSKQVSLPKISLLLQEIKIAAKSDKRPFCTKAKSITIEVIILPVCVSSSLINVLLVFLHGQRRHVLKYY